jgi:hypothetical protein
MNSQQLLSLFHVLIVGPLFLYVSLTAASLPAFAFPSLLALGVILLGYQGYKAYTKIMSGSGGYKINLFHVIAVAPVLLYIGYEKPDTTDFVYQLLLMLAFAVIGYHGYYLIHG